MSFDAQIALLIGILIGANVGFVIAGIFGGTDYDDVPIE